MHILISPKVFELASLHYDIEFFSMFLFHFQWKFGNETKYSMALAWAGENNGVSLFCTFLSYNTFLWWKIINVQNLYGNFRLPI